MSKCGLLLGLLFSLAQADPVKQEKSTSLSFGPPATHAAFDTAPLNPRRRLFGDNVDDQTSVLAFAKWYIEHLLNYPEDTWRVEESDVRKDPITCVWRVDARQVALNGTIEIVDGNISLNILNGEVISYGDSFYRGPPPDLTASDTPSQFADFNSYLVPVGFGQYNLQSYCITTSEVARKQWMRENPKWVEWSQPIQKSRKAGWSHPFQKSRKPWDKLRENQEKCQVNIERALEKCIEEHSSSSAPTTWHRRAWRWFRQEVLKDHSSAAYGYIPEECVSLQMRVPLDVNPPLPFKVPTTYDEDTCTWNFSTDYSTASARLYSLRQSHCDVRPKPECRCQRFDNGFDGIGFELEQLIQEDESELMEKEGIMDPAIAALVLVVSFPHGESESFQSVRGAAKDALGRIKSRRRPESGKYAFELKNVPGADGPVNATLVYVQTPPRRSHEIFTLEEEDDDDKETRPTSSLIPAWKLSILFKNGRRFDGYAEAKCQGALVRLLDLSILQNQALESPDKESERAESCLGWGESAAIREGVSQSFGRGSPQSDGNGVEPSFNRGEMVKSLTYRSLNGPLHWGIERMANVWADILSSVNRTIIAHCDEGTSEDETPADSNTNDDASETQTVSKSTILNFLIPASLALLPCNPTFLMARDALIQANQIIFSGNYTCDLWRGFAERGLGVNAHWDAEMMWTPWGGGKRKDGFDVPEECGLVGIEKLKADATRNRRDEL